jgi:hypothetical protein
MSDPNLIQSLGKGTIPTQDMQNKIFQNMTNTEEKHQKILQGQRTPSGSSGTIGKMGQNSTSNLTTGSPAYRKSINTFVKLNSDFAITIERDQMSKGRLSTLKDSLKPITNRSHSHCSLKDDESSSVSQMNQTRPQLPWKSLFLREPKSVSFSLDAPNNTTVKHLRSDKTFDAHKQHTPNSRPSKVTGRLGIGGSGTSKKE